MSRRSSLFRSTFNQFLMYINLHFQVLCTILYISSLSLYFTPFPLGLFYISLCATNISPLSIKIM